MRIKSLLSKLLEMTGMLANLSPASEIHDKEASLTSRLHMMLTNFTGKVHTSANAPSSKLSRLSTPSSGPAGPGSDSAGAASAAKAGTGAAAACSAAAPEGVGGRGLRHACKARNDKSGLSPQTSLQHECAGRIRAHQAGYKL